MSKLGCLCGHTISDTTDHLFFKGHVLKDQDKAALFTKLTDEMASYAAAVRSGTFEEWRQRRPWFREAADAGSWWRFLAMVWLQYRVHVYECTRCGRLWVQEGARSQRFVPFTREQPGSPVLPSEFWRGPDQPPLDPDPSLTERCR